MSKGSPASAPFLGSEDRISDYPPAYSEVEIPVVEGSSSDEVFPSTKEVIKEKALLHEASKYYRTVFLRFVYAILSAQVLAICGIIAVFNYAAADRIEEVGFFKFWSYWSGATVFALFTTTFSKMMRKPPMNLFLLVLATIFPGVILGSLAARLTLGDGLLISSGIVGLLCAFVVMFTFQHTFYYTPITSTCYIWTLLLVAYGILCVRFSPKESAYLIAAPVIFCTYMIVTTQFAIKNEEEGLKSNEFIYGACKISMYIVGVFAKIF